ncbi:hypothetical protein RQP46_006019 [Phenoliferia psychrophenolica]
MDEVENLYFRSFEQKARERADNARAEVLAARIARGALGVPDDDQQKISIDMDALESASGDEDHFVFDLDVGASAATSQEQLGYEGEGAVDDGNGKPPPSAVVLGKRKAIDLAPADARRASRNGAATTFASRALATPSKSFSSLSNSSTNSASRPSGPLSRVTFSPVRPAAPSAHHASAGLHPSPAGGYDGFWANMGNKSPTHPTSATLGANFKSPPSGLPFARTSPGTRPRSPFQPATSFASLSQTLHPAFTVAEPTPPKPLTAEPDTSPHLFLPPPLAPPKPKRGTAFLDRKLGSSASFTILDPPPPLPFEPFPDLDRRLSAGATFGDVQDDDVGDEGDEGEREPTPNHYEFTGVMSQDQEQEPITMEMLDAEYT